MFIKFEKPPAVGDMIANNKFIFDFVKTTDVFDKETMKTKKDTNTIC